LKKSKIGISIVIVVGGLIVLGVFSSADVQTENEQNDVFHVTLADPKIYENGVYTETFEIKKGTYKFEFVPNGDSPQNLKISLEGESVNLVEHFILKGTPHETGISTYYTWEYSGNNVILIPEDQIVKISIDPNGNLLGAITVDII